jgi:hypothetical protein
LFAEAGIVTAAEARTAMATMTREVCRFIDDRA